MRYGWSQHIVSVRHIPEWLPWFSYKPLARVGHELGIQVLYPPIRFVKESMVRDCLGIRLSLPKLPTKSVVAQWHGASLPCSRESSGAGELETERI